MASRSRARRGPRGHLGQGKARHQTGSSDPHTLYELDEQASRLSGVMGCRQLAQALPVAYLPPGEQCLAGLWGSRPVPGRGGVGGSILVQLHWRSRSESPPERLTEPARLEWSVRRSSRLRTAKGCVGHVACDLLWPGAGGVMQAALGTTGVSRMTDAQRTRSRCLHWPYGG